MANDAEMQDDSDAAWSEHYQEVSEAFARLCNAALAFEGRYILSAESFELREKDIQIVKSELGIK